MHYSIIIHHSSLTIEWITHRYSSYRFNNPFITMMIVLFTPSDALFKHQSIQYSLTLRFSLVLESIGLIDALFKHQSIQYSLILRRILVFDKRYNTPSHIIAMFNQMQYTSFSLSNAATSMVVFILIPVVQLISLKHLISWIFWV